MKLRIESDGGASSTRVYAVDSQGRKSRIRGVTNVDVHADPSSIEAQIVVNNPEVDFTIEDGTVKFEGKL